MNNLKSTAVILVLMGVLYGVYTTLNKPDLPPPQGMTADQIEQMTPPVVEMADASTSTGFANRSPSDSQAKAYSPPAFANTSTADVRSSDANSAPPPLVSESPGEATSPAEIGPPSTALPEGGPSIYGNPPAGELTPNDNPPAAATEVAPGSPQNPYRTSSNGNKNSGAQAAQPRSRYQTETASPEAVGRDSAVKLASGSRPVSTLHESVPNSSATLSKNPSGNPTIVNYDLGRAFSVARQQVDQQKLREALATLSPFYANPHITGEKRGELVSWLDALAARVIYSTDHCLADSHHVRGKGESLYDLAEQYQVPWQLLANINGAAVKNPSLIIPGTQLKVVPGPFRAEVDLTHNETILYLKDLYAGRFPCTIGSEGPREGQFEVREKTQQKEYFGIASTMAGNDPNNPYGGFWIDLGPGGSLHGSPVQGSHNANLGCISFSPRDAADIFGILSKGSTVTIRR